VLVPPACRSWWLLGAGEGKGLGLRSPVPRGKDCTKQLSRFSDGNFLSRQRAGQDQCFLPLLFVSFFFFFPLGELLFISYGAKLFQILFMFLQRDLFLNLLTLSSRVPGRLGKARLEIASWGVMGAAARAAPGKGQSCCPSGKARVFSPLHMLPGCKSCFFCPKPPLELLSRLSSTWFTHAGAGWAALCCRIVAVGFGALGVQGAEPGLLLPAGGETLGLNPACRSHGICLLWLASRVRALPSSSAVAQRHVGSGQG